MKLRNRHRDRDDGDDDHQDLEHQRHAGGEADDRVGANTSCWRAFRRRTRG
jgi:hypothetical protein